MRVIITGAASGIGRACAQMLAAGSVIAGEHQLLLADRDAANLESVADAIGPAAATCVVDLAELDCGDRIVAAAMAHMDGIDAVISNAGIIMGGALIDLPASDFDRIFAINTRSAWLLAKAAHPHLKASGGAFVATIFLGPGHADPLASAELTAEVRVEPKPALGAFHRRQCFQFHIEKCANFFAQLPNVLRSCNWRQLE